MKANIIIAIILIVAIWLAFFEYNETFGFTMAGATAAGLITWFAVYKTSELDKKSRRYECNYKYVQEKMWDFYNHLSAMSNLNHKLFSKDRKEYANISMTELAASNDFVDLLDLSMQLQYFNVPFKDLLMSFDKTIKIFLNIQTFLIKYFLEEDKKDMWQTEKKIISFQVEPFLKFLKENINDIDISDKAEEIYEVRATVLKQFELGNK